MDGGKAKRPWTPWKISEPCGMVSEPRGISLRTPWRRFLEKNVIKYKYYSTYGLNKYNNPFKEIIFIIVLIVFFLQILFSRKKGGSQVCHYS